MNAYTFLALVYFTLQTDRVMMLATMSYVYQFDKFNIDCRAESLFTTTSESHCAIICSSANCAGYVYDLTTGQCRTCPGDQVANLTFGSHSYKLRRIKSRDFQCDSTISKSYVVSYLQRLPVGTVVYMAMNVARGDGFIVNVKSNDLKFIYFQYNPRFYGQTALKSFSSNTWDPEIYMSPAFAYPYNTVVNHWFLVASDGFHIYINNTFYGVYPHKYNLSTVALIEAAGNYNLFRIEF